MESWERVKFVMEREGFNKNSFSEAIGLSSNVTITRIINEKRRASPNTCKKIVERFPQYSYNWLLRNEGDMIINPDVFQTGDQNINVSGRGNTNIGNRIHSYNEQIQTEDSNSEEPKHGIPLIPFDFIAGYGEDNAGISLNDCDRYIIPEFEHIGAEFLVRVGGSSMYPKYSSGDILACKKIHDILFFQWGKIYVIDSSQGQLIKRIFEHENEELIMLVSDNKEKYPPFSIPKNDIRSLSIVLGVVRME